MDEHFTADGHAITAGMLLWDNDVKAVRVERIADWPATDREPAWHLTVRVSDGRTSHSDGSRLAVRNPFTGKTVADSREG